MLSSYDVTRFGARARVFEPCKGCVAACFGACQFARIRLRVQVSDMTCRTTTPPGGTSGYFDFDHGTTI